MKSFSVFTIILLLDASPLNAHSGEKHDNRKTESIRRNKLELSGELAAIEIEYNRGVREIFEEKCFNCHSTKTIYPWYHKLPVVSSMINKDIEQALSHLDFTGGFPFNSHASPERDLKSIRNSILDGSMPPLRYKLMHWNHNITDQESKLIEEWIETSLTKLKSIEGEN